MKILTAEQFYEKKGYTKVRIDKIEDKQFSYFELIRFAENYNSYDEYAKIQHDKKLIK